MTTGKLSLIATGALLLILAVYAASGAFSRGDESTGGESASRLSRLFPGGDGSLEQRMRKLEESLEKSNRIQSQLLELVDELRRGLERHPADLSPAATAGLRPGDKIISYNGERVFHMGELHNQVYRVEPGKTVAVEVQRTGSSSRETIYVPSGPLGIQG
ncbi:PDZ domain-containing protein [Microbulbifer sp.]|uniref:PDZ domain-containing protein n=1 Tax=Microbulbifer sp. TaxID=1908541 RepID=UPI003F35BD64